MRGCDIDIVDFHSHILPNADHGSDSLETSLTQLKLAMEHGVKRIVATPHFYPHRHTLEKFLTRRDGAYKLLADNMSADFPSIKLGAEILVCEGLENLAGLESLTVEGTNLLLLELPFTELRNGYVDSVKKIIKNGFDVMLAHVDRYPHEDILRLIDIGVTKLQINAEALAKLFKDKRLFEFVEDGYVFAIGSDIHGADKKAYKKFTKAKLALGDSIFEIKEKSNAIWAL